MTAVLKPQPVFKYRPSPEYRFWLYDPEGNGMTYFYSAENRDEAADEAIQNYIDDGWSEEVEAVCAGEVTLMAQVLNKTMRPPEDEIGEDGCDSDGADWSDDIEWRGNYKLEPMPAPMLLDSNGNRSIFDDVEK